MRNEAMLVAQLISWLEAYASWPRGKSEFWARPPLPFLPVENFPQDGAGAIGADDGLGNCKNCTLMHVIAKKRTQIYALGER